MRQARALAITLGIFAFSFALHIVGGATDQGWLFALAVGLIYVSASGFGAIAWILAGAARNDRGTPALGSVAATVLTASALWAANDRSFAAWHVPAAIALVATTSAAIVVLWSVLRRRASRGQQPVRATG